MAVLRNDPDRSKRCRGSQNRAHIVRIRDLIEHQKDRFLGSIG